MNTGLIVEACLQGLSDRWAELVKEQPDAVLVSGANAGLRLADCEELLNPVLSVLLDVHAESGPDVLLDGLDVWPPGLSLVVHGRPDAVRAWVEAVLGYREQEEGWAQHEGAKDGKEMSDSPAHVWPRVIPHLRARHKEKVFSMNPERNLSGFTFYMPDMAAMEGYELVFDDDGEEEPLSHAERMRRFDLARWLGRYVAALEGMRPVMLLQSLTAEARGQKGYDIEMAAYCREKCGVPVIAMGGVGTVRHVLNFERHGQGAGIVLPDSVYDGSFSLHDVRAFVDEELAKFADRGSRLSLGVLGGGELAGSDMHGSYWQKPQETEGGHE